MSSVKHNVPSVNAGIMTPGPRRRSRDLSYS